MRIDGDLREWSEDIWRRPLPGPLVQVAGRSQAASARDASGRFWLALEAGGLAVAGEVSDDRVLFPRKESERLTSDHVELWIAFPGLAFPSEKVEECQTEIEAPPEPDCAVWRSSQDLYEKYLRRLFVRQYSLSGLGVREHHLAAAEVRESFGLPFPARPSLEGARAVFVPTPAGYAFEAWLPITALPATAKLPLRQMRVLVDLVDNDEGYAGQETFLSLARGRRFGDPASFLPVRFPTPVRLGSPDDLAELLLGLTPANRFVLPAETVSTVYAVVSLFPPGSEDEGPWQGPRPNAHPPWIVPLPLADARVLAKLGETEMVVIEDGGWVVFGYWGEVIRRNFRLVTRRPGSGWIASLPLDLAEGCPLQDDEGGICQVLTWERPPGLHVLMIDQTTQNSAGRGACGSCPVMEYEMVTLDPAGSLRRLHLDSVAGGPAGLPVSVVPSALAGARLDEAARELFPGWEEASGWLRTHPVVGRRTLPASFDVAFATGGQWINLSDIVVVTLRYDAAAGRYQKSEITYAED